MLRNAAAVVTMDPARPRARFLAIANAPVERIEPLPSVYAAVTRLDQPAEPAGGWYPRQCLTVEAAVRAYTSGSAAAERVELTVVGGRITFEGGTF